MKRLTLLVLAMAVAATAGQKSNDVRVKYKDVALTFFSQPLVEAKVLPLVDVIASKERFGFHFGKTDPTSPIIELVGIDGKVVKSLSVNDMLGKGVAKQEELLPAGSASPRRISNTYSLRTAQGETQIILRALATGNDANEDQRLVMTFGVKTEQKSNFGMRVRLPFSGSAELAQGGVIISSQTGNAAIAISVFPSQMKMSSEKNSIDIACEPRAIDASHETAMLWLVIKGVSSLSPTDAKTQSLACLRESADFGNDPRLVVVNTSDKQKLTQGDTAAYTIICKNIGSGEATGVILGNPVPRGAKYIVGSATTAGASFSLEGNSALSGSQNLKWILSEPLLPGEERVVSFKMALQ